MIISRWPEQTLAVLRSRPGIGLQAVQIARKAGLSEKAMMGRLREMERFGIAARQSRRWILGPAADLDVAIIQMREARPRRARPIKSPRLVALDAVQAEIVGKLRRLLADGQGLSDEPQRLAAEAVHAARALMAAKRLEGCRFSGAEVDLMVAAELRQISEAARRATLNLRELLGVLVG